VTLTVANKRLNHPSPHLASPNCISSSQSTLAIMELPDLGDHCTLKDCSRLDFLPFRCDKCGLTFCLDHRNPASHSCDRLQAEEGASGEIPVGMKTEKVTYACSFTKANCKNKELTPVICPKCTLPFCLTHRHPPDHDCAVYREEEKLKWEKENKMATKTTKQVPSLNQRPLRNAKARQMAAKVALMKMKLHAKGEESIPQTERVYFWVAMPRTGFHGAEEDAGEQQQQQRPDLPLFFCERWSLGRAIDFIASKQRLRNANNVASARKLRLFRHEDGSQLTDMSKTVKEVVDEKVVFSGSALVLEYVDPEAVGNVDVDPKLYPL